jgi:hypothetical protein
MSNEEIEGNKLIAEFMGLKRNVNNKNYLYDKYWISARGLKYHSSWDWQIPVYGKITLAVKTLIPKLPNPEENCRWYFRNLRKYENAIFNNEPIEGHKIVVEFINWYTLNKAQ